MAQSKAEAAKEFFAAGYNCAQAVTGAFCGEMGLSFEQAVKLAAPFGGGLARMRELCGAVSGMAMVAGAVYGGADPADRAEKAAHYALVQDLTRQFRERNGSIVCRELLAGVAVQAGPAPEERTEQYYKKRPCAEYVADAAELLEQLFAAEA